jgi:hypothetical protein
MIVYTLEETMDLLDHLNFFEEVWGDGLPKYENRSFKNHIELLDREKNRFIFANIHLSTGVLSEICIRDLVDIIHYMSFDISFVNRCVVSYHDEMKGYIRKLIHFIRRTPLEEVPLYISSFMEIAAWRLRIGK